MKATVVCSIGIFDPDLYAAAPPHEEFARLRAVEPVSRQPLADGTECWAILKHADVVQVAREPVLFSASEGGVVLDDLPPERLEMMRMMLLAMDPPRHSEYRRPLAATFGRSGIDALEPQVRRVCREIMRAGEVEFVHDVCALLPSQVIGDLMGLPRDDWPQIHRWAELTTSGDDGNAAIDMAMYAIEFAGHRRAAPARDDLTSLILATTFGDAPMTDVDFGSFFVQLVTAGNDTTKTLLSSGLLALLQHPDQLEALRTDRRLLPGAIEEILRFANPLHYFRRTATADAEVRGVKIAKGDKVAMVYTSANRDEDVFTEPDRFDIRRDPNPHLSFGIAQHFCLGAHLARLEGRTFFDELLTTFSSIELTGEPVRHRSNLNNGLTELPVRLRP